MSEVKRYVSTYDLCGDGDADMKESETGDYVDYQDYAALKAERDAIAAENLVIKSLAYSLAEECAQTVGEVELTMSSIGTPATDAYANQLRAEGGAKALEDFAEFNIKSIDPGSDEYTEVLMEVSRAARGFAANLRKGNGHD